jgi:16S rRNA (cytosine1402-N4)-methyltransferase
MTASSDSEKAVAGGLARHIPVLVRAAVEFLAVRDGGVYVDATFGGGGYSREILAAADCCVIGIDRDHIAIARGAELARTAGGRLHLFERKLSELLATTRSTGKNAVDGVVFDLGVSSLQLDDPARGFSFRHDGPLDMRMGGSGPTAAEVVASAREQDLARIIATLGEERHARAIARAIVRARRAVPLRNTRALAEIVAAVVPTRTSRIHPATRTFQALRIFVNDELAELAVGLSAAEQLLKPGGRLVAVTFHSLEDRIVKVFLTQRAMQSRTSRHVPPAQSPPPSFKPLNRHPVVPAEAEIIANPRARSAKLRAAERTDAPPMPARAAGLLPRLPSLADVLGRAQ